MSHYIRESKKPDGKYPIVRSWRILLFGQNGLNQEIFGKLGLTYLYEKPPHRGCIAEKGYPPFALLDIVSPGFKRVR